MDTSATGRYEVRLFAMSDDGGLPMLDATTGPGWARHLLFHPSGRFLYLSLAPSPGSFSLDSLWVYSIDAQGHLGEVETLEGGGGTMAVTLPPQVRASAAPGSD
jgi:6-phosphogluconolactonase (cycloisomerase 2 family)